MNENFSLSCNTLHISQNVFREARRVLLRYLIVLTMPVALLGTTYIGTQNPKPASDILSFLARVAGREGTVLT